MQPDASAVAALVSESWSSTPTMALRTYTDLYGNPCTRVVLPVGVSTFRYEALVDVVDAVEDVDVSAPEVAPDASRTTC